MNDSPEPRNGGISTHERLEVVGATLESPLRTSVSIDVIRKAVVSLTAR